MPEPITDEEMLEMCSNPPEEYTREQLKEEMEYLLGFLKTFVTGQRHYYEGPEAARENLLIVARYWADDILKLRWKARDNWNFAMRIIDCHIGRNNAGNKA